MRDRLISAAILFSIGYAITFLAGWWFPWTSIVLGVLLLVVTVLALFDADTRAALGFAGFLGFAVFGFLLLRSGRAELRNNAATTAEVEKIGQQITLAETTLAQGQIDDAIRLCVELEPKVGKDEKARLEQIKARAENRIMQRTASDVWKLIESEDFATAEAKIRAVLNEAEATRREPASRLLETILLETIFKEREKIANKKLADIVAKAQAEFSAGRITETEKLLNQAKGLAHATELGDFNKLKVNVEAAIRDEQRKKEEIAKLRQREKEKREEVAGVMPNPGKVAHKITDTQFVFNGKRIEVQLSGRLSEDELRALAMQLKNSDRKKYDRTLIMYYVPDMEAGVDPKWKTGQAWATTHFDPDLEIRILGTTREEHERLAKEAAKPAGDNAIGRWTDNESANQRIITLLKEGGKIFMTTLYGDESFGKDEMIVRTVKNQIRYIKKDDPGGDYWIITPKGDLSWGDADEGIWATSKRNK